jgi:hypothetical protein
LAIALPQNSNHARPKLGQSLLRREPWERCRAAIQWKKVIVEVPNQPAPPSTIFSGVAPVCPETIEKFGFVLPKYML